VTTMAINKIFVIYRNMGKEIVGYVPQWFDNGTALLIPTFGAESIPIIVPIDQLTVQR